MWKDGEKPLGADTLAQGKVTANIRDGDRAHQAEGHDSLGQVNADKISPNTLECSLKASWC